MISCYGIYLLLLVSINQVNESISELLIQVPIKHNYSLIDTQCDFLFTCELDLPKH